MPLSASRETRRRKVVTVEFDSSVPANVQDRQIAILRAWHGVMSGSLWDFSEEERSAALRAAYAVSHTIAEQVRVERVARLEDMREHGSPSVHVVMFTHGGVSAEAAIRDGL